MRVVVNWGRLVAWAMLMALSALWGGWRGLVLLALLGVATGATEIERR